MDCSEALEQVAARPSTDSRATAALHEHLQGCAACRMEQTRVRALWAALSDPAADMTVSDGFAQAVQARMFERLGQRRRTPDWRPRWLWAGALAGAAMALVLLVKAGRDRWGTAGGAFPDGAGLPGVTATRTTPPAAGDEPLPPSLAALVENRLPMDGERGKAVAFIGARYGGDAGAIPPNLVEALVRTLRTDRNPGVRRKAAEALAGLPPTRQICDAFLAALRTDRNPVVRGIAVEALGRAARDLDGPSIEGLRDRAADLRESEHLRVKAANTLKTISL